MGAGRTLDTSTVLLWIFGELCAIEALCTCALLYRRQGEMQSGLATISYNIGYWIGGVVDRHCRCCLRGRMDTFRSVEGTRSG